MQKSLKNILMSGAAAGAVVGGTLLAVNYQLTTPQTEGSTLESTSKPTPKLKEGSSTPSVSSFSEGSSMKEEVKSTTSEKKDESVGQAKEDATSTSTVPSIQEKQMQEEVKEEPKAKKVEIVSDRVEETPRTLNPTTTVRHVSEPIEKTDVSKLNQTRKVMISVPRKETPKPTAVSSETPKVQPAPQSHQTAVVEQPRLVEQPRVVEQPRAVEQPTTSTVVETPQPTQPTQSEVVSEKGQPLVQEENPVGIISDKGTSLIQDEKPVGVVFEKGESLVQEELPIYTAPVSTPIAEVKSEKGVPEIQTPLEELVITEKGEPLVQPVKQELTITSKGQPLVQEENPTYVFSEKGQPEVREELPLGVFSEKGEPLVESNKPLGIVFEKGEPEVLLGTVPEYKFKIVRREDVIPIATAFLNLGDFRREVGTKDKTVKGHQGNITKVYEDVVAEDGTILNSTLKSDTTTDPVYHVYRYGTKPVGSHKGEEGLYRLHEHTSEMDIVDFRQDITLTGEEIQALGQDEINRRAKDESLQNNITLANHKSWSKVRIVNAPLSEDTIAKFNDGTYINHKNVGLEVLKLVNEERKRLGLSELIWSDELYALTKIRAGEIGKNGHIRFWNSEGKILKHVRDTTGKKWLTVLHGTSFANQWAGENLAGFTVPQNIYVAFSEKILATQLYTQWRNSPSHYENMIAKEYKRFAFDVVYSTFWREDNLKVDYLAQGIHGVQLFAS